ncbi:ferrous iron transport protein A [Orrella sp. NBD-18]|uniref:Ferrous iron transport protein A n=1 Tax=Sheuella amnicola TaxID=2707330 RepID=A0A6B2QXF0_9BURK|nr:FeoA family protein [Sheuella amnicola]NDY82683.1 ferrous iron transport protein A [Sheuella amnicola]HBI83108.1 ferrous iron transport protein A [Alcaligenaceae bacterium]
MQQLHQAKIGQAYRIVAVRHSQAMPECDRQLNELGFMPGEQIVLLRRAMPGADPLVVRIGMSTFALRSAEAACVEVELEDTHG